MVVSNRFQLFVRSTSTVAVEALSTDSVGFLLEEAARKLGACYGDAWLSHGGKLLHLDGTLESFGIGKGATLHLAFRGRGGDATVEGTQAIRLADPSSGRKAG